MSPKKQQFQQNKDKLLTPGAGCLVQIQLGNMLLLVHQSQTPPVNLNKVSNLARRDTLGRALMI